MEYRTQVYVDKVWLVDKKYGFPFIITHIFWFILTDNSETGDICLQIFVSITYYSSLFKFMTIFQFIHMVYIFSAYARLFLFVLVQRSVLAIEIYLKCEMF